ncbi:hypothetical protein CSAL01_10704 [Colletotrichum salicis]|uniref:Uncharacterized protein n=1 Tax=Colletotrichum salicis TaxID=1209931 RepID=A0A135V1L1_9PEZI|nr:hypothetical protein CSAL01_10704 [Colletotrichum salicis]
MAPLTSALMPQAPGDSTPEKTPAQNRPLASGDASAGGSDVLPPEVADDATATYAGAFLDDSLTAAAAAEGLQEIGALGGAAAGLGSDQPGSGLYAEGLMGDPEIYAAEGCLAGLNAWHTTSYSGADRWPGPSGADYIARGYGGAMGDSDYGRTADMLAATGATMAMDTGRRDCKFGEDIELMCLDWECVAIGPGMFLVMMPL